MKAIELSEQEITNLGVLGRGLNDLANAIRVYQSVIATQDERWGNNPDPMCWGRRNEAREYRLGVERALSAANFNMLKMFGVKLPYE